MVYFVLSKDMIASVIKSVLFWELFSQYLGWYLRTSSKGRSLNNGDLYGKCLTLQNLLRILSIN